MILRHSDLERLFCAMTLSVWSVASNSAELSSTLEFTSELLVWNAVTVHEPSFLGLPKITSSTLWETMERDMRQDTRISPEPVD